MDRRRPAGLRNRQNWPSPTRAYCRPPIADKGPPISPATSAASSAGAGGARESGDMTKSRSQAIAALSL